MKCPDCDGVGGVLYEPGLFSSVCDTCKGYGQIKEPKMGQPQLVTAVVARHITVTEAVHAFHRWADAPDEVKFLRDYHRHKFMVAVTIEVTHGDRQVEFFTAQQTLRSVLRQNMEGKRLEGSCETFAENVGKEMVHNGYKVSEVEVSEDGENSGTVTFDTVRKYANQDGWGTDKTPAEVKAEQEIVEELAKPKSDD